jgi:hypothetical protein
LTGKEGKQNKMEVGATIHISNHDPAVTINGPLALVKQENLHLKT